MYRQDVVVRHGLANVKSPMIACVLSRTEVEYNPAAAGETNMFVICGCNNVDVSERASNPDRVFLQTIHIVNAALALSAFTRTW